MQDKKNALIDEIKQLWHNNLTSDFDIAPELLDYLEVKDLEELKKRILSSLSTLTPEQKEWLQQFKKE